MSVDRASSSGGLEIEESIAESIADSYSQSFQSASKSKSQSEPRSKYSSPRKDSARDEIEESMPEEISEYSEDFNKSDASEGLVGSRNKLQVKAQHLQESAAYSEDFDDDSISKSQQLPAPGPPMADKTPKMESVKEEESVDDSHQRSASGSKLDRASSH